MSQAAYKPHYEHLKNLWTEQHREIQKEISQKHSDAFKWLHHNVGGAAIGTFALAMGMVTPSVPAAADVVRDIPKQVADTPLDDINSVGQHVFLLTDLKGSVPSDVRPLTPEEERQIGNVLSQRFGLNVTAELDGKRLNRSYGYIGAEQHLMRYPGDTIATHFQTVEEANEYARSGMAPGRGAWGYFSSSSGLTQKDIDREKYYIAVQTFLAPGFMDNVREHYEFYKYRKMLVVNPDNGKAIVVVIGDAGPAEWTGKSLGGSPEVMRYLNRVDGSQKGPVLYFFVDDPEDKIPLGPIEAV